MLYVHFMSSSSFVIKHFNSDTNLLRQKLPVLPGSIVHVDSEGKPIKTNCPQPFTVKNIHPIQCHSRGYQEICGSAIVQQLWNTTAGTLQPTDQLLCMWCLQCCHCWPISLHTQYFGPYAYFWCHFQDKEEGWLLCHVWRADLALWRSQWGWRECIWMLRYQWHLYINCNGWL